MPAASTSRQPERALSWFDEARGCAMLASEQALLMPMIVRAAGNSSCLMMPSARAALSTPTTLMRNEVRIWCDAAGWHRAEHGVQENSLPPARSIDLLLACHVMTSSTDAATQMNQIAQLLAPGGVVLLAEFNPFSLYRRHWSGRVPSALWPSRCTALAVEAGLDVAATYTLSPGFPRADSGLLIRRGWRPLSWLPLPVYVVRARKRAPGITPVGSIMPAGFSLEYPHA